MSFEVAADSYDRFMGRWSVPLAARFAQLVEVPPGARVLDVGCGPGALTGELVRLHGAARVSAVDPSEPFVQALHERFPEVDVHHAAGADLLFADGTFGAAFAQLVVNFMPDPVAGLAEMARVARGGTVAACLWDYGGDRSPLSPFWTAAHRLDPGAADESTLPGLRQGELVDLFRAAGLTDVVETALTVTRGFADLDEWWEPFTFGVGPAGVYVTGLTPAQRGALREECGRVLPPAPFVIESASWAVHGRSVS